MNKGSIVERLCSDLDRKEPRYKSPTLLFTLPVAEILLFYRAMPFSAKRGLAIACHLSVCPSVTLVDCDHPGWNSSEIISPLVSVGCSLSANPNIRGSTPRGTPRNFGQK